MNIETVTEIRIEAETQITTSTYKRKDMDCKQNFLKILPRPVCFCSFTRESWGRAYSRYQTMILLPRVPMSESGNLEE